MKVYMLNKGIKSKLIDCLRTKIYGTPYLPTGTRLMKYITYSVYKWVYTREEIINYQFIVKVRAWNITTDDICAGILRRMLDNMKLLLVNWQLIYTRIYTLYVKRASYCKMFNCLSLCDNVAKHKYLVSRLEKWQEFVYYYLEDFGHMLNYSRYVYTSIVYWCKGTVLF